MSRQFKYDFKMKQIPFPNSTVRRVPHYRRCSNRTQKNTTLFSLKMTIPNQYEDEFTWNVMERNCKCQLMFADLQDLVR